MITNTCRPDTEWSLFKVEKAFFPLRNKIGKLLIYYQGKTNVKEYLVLQVICLNYGRKYWFIFSKGWPECSDGCTGTNMTRRFDKHRYSGLFLCWCKLKLLQNLSKKTFGRVWSIGSLIKHIYVVMEAFQVKTNIHTYTVYF